MVLVSFNLANPRERLSTNNSLLIQKRWLLTTGHVLYSDEGNVMLRTTDDTAVSTRPRQVAALSLTNFRR